MRFFPYWDMGYGSNYSLWISSWKLNHHQGALLWTTITVKISCWWKETCISQQKGCTISPYGIKNATKNKTIWMGNYDSSTIFFWSSPVRLPPCPKPSNLNGKFFNSEHNVRKELDLVFRWKQKEKFKIKTVRTET